jgi:hypothetical protein
LYHLRDALSRFFSVSLDGLTIIPHPRTLVNAFFLFFFIFLPFSHLHRNLPAFRRISGKDGGA